eukprot:206064_1
MVHGLLSMLLVHFSGGTVWLARIQCVITVISPITSSCAAFVWMHFGFVWLHAIWIGLSSVVYFGSAYVLPWKPKRIVANVVYDTPGIIHSESFEHFSVPISAIACCDRDCDNNWIFIWKGMKMWKKQINMRRKTAPNVSMYPNVET